MSYYQAIATIATKYFGVSKAFKYGFNWSPMYRRSNARIIAVSKDLMKIEIRLPLTYKNVNYMNSMFGGSMFAAVDPIPMIQLVSILGKEYVVWDKSAEIYFKRPAKENLFATFEFSNEEVEEIKSRVKSEKARSIQLTEEGHIYHIHGNYDHTIPIMNLKADLKPNLFHSLELKSSCVKLLVLLHLHF